jgi:DHA2 family multidrug resistance protein
MTTLLIPTFLQGAAVACFFIPLVTITLSGLRTESRASGVSNFRGSAGGFGVDLDHALGEPRGDASRPSRRIGERRRSGDRAGAVGFGASGYDAQSLALVDRLVNVRARAGRRRRLLRLAVIFLALLPLI